MGYEDTGSREGWVGMISHLDHPCDVHRESRGLADEEEDGHIESKGTGSTA